MLVNTCIDKDFQEINWYLDREELSPSETGNFMITNTYYSRLSERLKKESN